ncbi:hypothetical protein DY000_02061649 [Brassica cretica]|uniref:Uncharacterized protein n=1 Tax=Brassica cretica TaxID=69181 RepID=A0ABQ7ASB8_BRACR|nr:hypothetical protein DY000_02061649 [Brassica cretica]
MDSHGTDLDSQRTLMPNPMDSHGTDLALHENFGTFSSLIGSQNQQQPIGSSFQAPFSRTWSPGPPDSYSFPIVYRPFP